MIRGPLWLDPEDRRVPFADRLGAKDARPGHYAARLAPGGPLVPVRIWLVDGDRDPATGELLSDQRLHATVADQTADPITIWPWLVSISRERFDMLLAEGRAEASNPASPHARPDARADFDTMPPRI